MSDTSDFMQSAEKERERLTKLRDKLTAQLSTIQDDMEKIDTDLSRLDIFFGATPTPRKGKKGTRGPRSTGRTASLLSLIQSIPDGIKRADILEKMGAKGDKSQENTISTALTNLKKQGKIGLTDGIYRAA